MPAPANVTEYLEVVRKSGLVPEDRLHQEIVRFRESVATPQTIEQLAGLLVRDGLLTRFQAKQIKVGRYKRFEIAGKYRLLELLGVGGMGAVYLCEHMFLKRLVALKVLPVEKLREPSALMRFYREARAVAALDHPNIVRAYDIDKFDQLHFLVMEYVDGASIQEVVARHGPLDPARAAHYTAQSAHGLHHAHQLGMVHRDIKPGNLLLERTGVVKVLDMGLARFFDQASDNVTEKFDNNCVLGTADYLAPEQAVNNVVDIRADIYALGGSFYFMLTGQSPFPDGTIAHKLLSHQNQEPKPITDFRKDVPEELLEIIARMMHKKPEQRYQTPAELYDALTPWAEMPIAPPPVQEMPDLCPAVLALAGHAADRARSSNARLPVSGSHTGLSGLHRGFSDSAHTPRPGSKSNALQQTSTSAQSPTHPIEGLPAVVPGIGDSEVNIHTVSRTPSITPARSKSGEANSYRWLLLGFLAIAMLMVAALAGAIAVLLFVRPNSHSIHLNRGKTAMCHSSVLQENLSPQFLAS